MPRDAPLVHQDGPTGPESLALAGAVLAAAGTTVPWVVTSPWAEVVPAVVESMPYVKSVEHLVDDVFEVSEEPTDRVSGRRSIEATARPDNRVPKLSLDRTDAVDVLVVAVKKATHQLRWFVVSCSPRPGRGEHAELLEKLEGVVLEQR